MSDHKLNNQEKQETVIMAVRHDAEALIAKAIDKKVPVETMERLLVMRRELKAEWAKEHLIKPWQLFKRIAQLLKKQKRKNDTEI